MLIFKRQDEINDLEKLPERKFKNSNWIELIVFLLVVTNVITFSFSSYLNSKANKLTKTDVVRNAIDKYYMGDINSDAIDLAAAKAEVAQLNDPYSVFMDKSDYSSFNIQTGGSFAGIGVSIGVKDGKIIIVAPIAGGPAEKAGILAGDYITKIEDKAVTDKDINKVQLMIKGTLNTKVKLTIQRGTEIKDYLVNRENIELNPIKSEILSGNIGYIIFTEFDKDSGEKFSKVLKELVDKKVKGLILDIRGNPGGLLDEAVNITSNFIPKDKVIVSIRDKNNNETRYNSVGGSAIGLNLVVLVDGNSASASEVFSGAIRDYGVGTLVGEKTFGKGIVQSILDGKAEGFGDGTALKITTAKYFSPKGININKIGITPDVIVKYPDALKQKAYDRSTDPQFTKALEVILSKIK